jgi:serine/threonine-protein kinase
VEALEAIVEAHAAGIVHRDLKPSNLFLAARAEGPRRVKVLDFGISKVAEAGAGRVDAALTSTKSMLGSPGYMSPEQVRSTKNVDVRTDVWALGVILYEMLTGAPAFQGETLGDVFAKIREEDLPSVRARRPDVPEGLAAVLSQCLKRDRAQRIPDAATLRARLAPFAARGETRAGSAAAMRDVVASAPTLAAPALSAEGSDAQRLGAETLATWTGNQAGKRGSRLVIGGAAVALLAGGVIGWFLMRGPPPRADVPPPPASVAAGASAPLTASVEPTVTPSEPLAGVPSASAPPPPATAPPTAQRPSSHPKPQAPKPAQPKPPDHPGML